MLVLLVANIDVSDASSSPTPSGPSTVTASAQSPSVLATDVVIPLEDNATRSQTVRSGNAVVTLAWTAAPASPASSAALAVPLPTAFGEQRVVHDMQHGRTVSVTLR